MRSPTVTLEAAEIPPGWTKAPLGTPPAFYRPPEPPLVGPVPVRRFSDTRGAIEASRPIAVRISMGEHLFFAESENLRIYASGESVSEAIQDFGSQVLYFYRHYRKLTEREVVGEAARLMALYHLEFREIR